MAEETGFDVEFAKKPVTLLHTNCAICHLVLSSPCETICCGVYFCKACLEKYQRYKQTCPNCRGKLDWYKSKGQARQINQLEVFCEHKERGCEWVGELGQLKEHLNKNSLGNNGKHCKFVLVACDWCHKEVERGNFDQHKSEECPSREVECLHQSKGCDWMGPHSTLDQHLNLNLEAGLLEGCGFVQLDCMLYQCGKSIERRNYEQHDAACQLELIECEFKSLGCEDRVARKDMPAHLEKYIQHLRLASIKITKECEYFKAEKVDTKNLIQVVQAEREEIRNEREEIEAEREQIKAVREDIKNVREIVKAEREEIKTEKEEVRAERKELKSERENIKNVREVVKAEREEVKAEREEIKAEREEMKAERVKLLIVVVSILILFIGNLMYHKGSVSGDQLSNLNQSLLHQLQLDNSKLILQLQLDHSKLNQSLLHQLQIDLSSLKQSLFHQIQRENSKLNQSLLHQLQLGYSYLNLSLLHQFQLDYSKLNQSLLHQLQLGYSHLNLELRNLKLSQSLLGKMQPYLSQVLPLPADLSLEGCSIHKKLGVPWISPPLKWPNKNSFFFLEVFLMDSTFSSSVYIQLRTSSYHHSQEVVFELRPLPRTVASSCTFNFRFRQWVSPNEVVTGYQLYPVECEPFRYIVDENRLLFRAVWLMLN